MQTKGRAAALLAATLLAACNPSEDDADSGETAQAVPVEIAIPTRGNIVATQSGTAAIEAFAEARVVAKVGGEIREILAEEGDDVRAGQVLARLDGDRLRLDLAQAEARLQKLHRDFQRNRDLRERGLISEGDFENIQYEMEALEATRNLASLELGYTEIRAPIDGVISERLVKKGNTIDVNAPMFSVTSLEPLVAYLHVPEREYRRIEPGMPVSLHVDALPDENFDAVVARVSPVVDPATGTFKITIEVTDTGRRLKPGMFARINIVSDTRQDALQVPRNAIIDEAGETSIFVVSDNVAERRAIRTGFASKGQVEVVDGLDDDDQVVVVGHTGLRDGSKVAIANAGGDALNAVAVAPAPAADEG